MATLFESAARSPEIIMKIVDGMRSAASDAGVTLADDPLQFMQLASANAAFKSNLQSQLSRIADESGLVFAPEVPVAVPGAEARLDAMKTLNAPKEGPISMPVVLLFAACVLIFSPSAFKSVGGTLFGEGGAACGVEGLLPFDF